MDNNLHPWTNCLVTALGKAAEDSLRLPHNARTYTAEDDTVANTLLEDTRGTPDRGLGSRGQTSLTLEPESFIDPVKGVVFGSDADRCDILIHPNNSDGISGIHFALRFGWNVGPDPTILIIVCLSQNRIRLNNSIILGKNQKQSLNPRERNLIEVAGRHFQLETIKWKGTQNQANFDKRWKAFVQEVKDQEPRLEPAAAEDEGDPTPWRPVEVGSDAVVRYMPCYRLVHFDDLCLALALSPRESRSLPEELDLTLERLEDAIYVKLDHASKLAEHKLVGGARQLSQAVAKLARVPYTFETGIRPAFTKAIVPASTVPASIDSRGQAARIQPLDASEFDHVMVIHQGPFSEVHQMVERTTGRLVAVKTLTSSQRAKQQKNLLNEVKFLPRLRHPRIVDVEAVAATRTGFEIRMELLNLGNLKQHVENEGVMDERICARYVDQILDALVYIHARSLIHRDIKPENILLASLEPFNVKLSDFGLVKDLHADAQQSVATFCGSPAFLAPETCGSGQDGSRPDGKVDIWALGVTLWFTLSAGYPFDMGSGPEPCPIFDNGPDFGALQQGRNISGAAIDIIGLMLSVAAKDRPSAATLRQHCWITGSETEKNNARLEKSSDETLPAKKPRRG